MSKICTAGSVLCLALLAVPFRAPVNVRTMVYWDTPRDASLYVELEYRELGATGWLVLGRVPSDVGQLELPAWTEGSWEIRARSADQWGQTSDWTEPVVLERIAEVLPPPRPTGVGCSLVQP